MDAESDEEDDDVERVLGSCSEEASHHSDRDEVNEVETAHAHQAINVHPTEYQKDVVADVDNINNASDHLEELFYKVKEDSQMQDSSMGTN